MAVQVVEDLKALAVAQGVEFGGALIDKILPEALDLVIAKLPAAAQAIVKAGEVAFLPLLQQALHEELAKLTAPAAPVA